jgi:hypothetical protein
VSSRFRIAGWPGTSLRNLTAVLLAAAGLALLFVPVSAAAAATLSGTVSGQPASGEPKGLAEVKVTASDSATGKFVTSAGSGLGGKYALELPEGVFDIKFDPGLFSPYQATTISKLEVFGPVTLNVTLKEKEPSSEDTEAPKIDELSIKPSSIDTSAAPQTVTLSAHITDNLAGFKAGSVLFSSPSGKQQVAGFEFKRTAGTDLNGSYEIPVSFKQFSPSGNWELSAIRLADHVGNERELTPGQIEELGFPHTVFVQGGGGEEDVEAPKLDELVIEPEVIDTSAEGQNVSIFAHIGDDLSGLKEVRVAFLSPSGKQFVQGFANEPIEGSATNGLFKIPVSFKQFSEAGTWTISSIFLGDYAGHERNLSPEQVEELGLPDKVFVEGEGDTEPPQLHSLEIEPTEIDTSTSKQPVFVTMAISDNPSGFKDGQVIFAFPGGKQVFGSEFKLISGTEKEGTYRVLVTFPQGSEPGEWNLLLVRLDDQAGNEVKIPREELEAAGLPHTVFVTAASPAVTGVEPSSGPEAGGTEVLISGSAFSGAKEVRFGSTPASEFSVKSPTLIRAVAPPGIGVVDVSVTTPSGTGEASPADRFTYSPQVTLSSASNPSVHGQKVTFTAKVIPAFGGSPTPLGTVAFVEGSTTLGVANLSKGTATLNTTALGAGKHPVTAVYSGDAHYGFGESPAITQNVEKASTQLLLASSLNPAAYGSNATLKATVNAIAPGAGTPAGTVTFREGETVIDTVQLNGHSASLSLKALTPGEHAISASYSGDPNNQPSAGEPLVQTIVNAATETSLTSSLNPAPYGSSATLKATVDSVAPSVVTPTGTVSFREGETVLAIVPLSAGGVAKYALKTVAPGSYEITATYNGGEGFEASGSTLKQTIVKASTELTLTSSKNPAPKGSSGTLKATVKALAPGGGTPNGTVTFREGETVLATIPLTSSSVTYPLKSLAVGTHNVTATYSGSANYLESEGAIAQVITP